MVAAGPVDMTILKAKFGSDIRKSALRHNNDLTFNDLYLMVQRIFGINQLETIVLKYKDSDGDLVTLVDDSDVLLALQSEPTLFIEVLVDSPASKAVASVQEQIASLQVATERLVHALAELEVSNVSQKNTSQMNGGCCNDSVVANVPSVPSPVPCKQEIQHVAPPPPATIQPSSHEQVSSDGTHQFRHAPDSEMSLAHSTVEEDIPLGADASVIHPPSPQFPPFQAQPQVDCQAPPPPQQFGAPPQQFGAPPQPEHQAPPTSIPSFPHSQAPPPVQSSGAPSASEQLQSQQFSTPSQGSLHQFGASQGPPQFGGQAPPPNFNVQQQQFAPPPQFGAPQPTPPTGSVSSTPAPQGPPQFGAPVQGPPSQFGGQAPPSPHIQQGPPSQFGGQPPAPPQFAPPPPQFGGPASSQGPLVPGHFPVQGPPHPVTFPGAPQPGGEQQNQQPQFAPPTSFAPPGSAPQFGGQAPPAFPPGAGFPPVGAPPMGAPPMGAPPMGAPPMGGLGGPGGNPFARGPGGPPAQYRQSPYQQ